MVDCERSLIETTIDDGILLLRIDNLPDNFLSKAAMRDLDACRDLMLSREVRAVVFTGRGRAFSKGTVVEEIWTDPSIRERIRMENETLRFIAELDKPTFAAINGACFGGGLELALCCHVRVCSDRAWFGLPEVTLGLVPGWGGIERLIRVVGEAKALEMILLGDVISGQQALQTNLVSRVLPNKDFLQQALAFVRTVLAHPQEALESVVKLVRARSSDEYENISGAAAELLDLVNRRRPK